MNFEEACDFLIGRMPAGWSLRRLDGVFEPGADGWLFFGPYNAAGRFTYAKAVRKLGVARAIALTLIRPFVYHPVFLLDWLTGLLLWGWRGRIAYHNLFCRDVWVVLDRDIAPNG